MSGVTIVLLCEDKQTDSFVRRFLKHRNFKYRDITTVSLSAGSGSGEQRVKEQYPTELKAIRQKAIRQKEQAYLIVVIDADTHTVDERHAELKQACEEEGILPRNSRDANVLHIIPRRNIETWFAYLEGNNVNESEIYPKLKRERDCKEHAERLHHMCQTRRLREPVPPSLLEACNEYRSLCR